MEKTNEVNLLTKECILTALLRLMDEKPYESITITDITSLAGVSRMAYYRNYKNKDDILIDKLFDEERKLEESIPLKDDVSFYDVILYVSDFIQENADVINALYSAGLGYRLTDMLNDRIYNYFPVTTVLKEGKYAVAFYVGAILSVFKLWINGGMIETAEEISKIIYMLVDRENALEYAVLPNEK